MFDFKKLNVLEKVLQTKKLDAKTANITIGKIKLNYTNPIIYEVNLRGTKWLHFMGLPEIVGPGEEVEQFKNKWGSILTQAINKTGFTIDGKIWTANVVLADKVLQFSLARYVTFITPSHLREPNEPAHGLLLYYDEQNPQVIPVFS